MKSEVGLFQVEEVLIPKIQSSPAKHLVELYAKIGDEVKKRLPSQPVYVHFISPRWTVRIGNFRKQEHASSLLKTMKKFGYRQACIVKGVVNIKRR